MTRKIQLKFSKPSKTVNSQAYEHNINNMVQGLTPFTQAKRSFYIDDTIFPDHYETIFNQVQAAQAAFMSLSPDIREQFGNDPANLSRALGDPSTHAALRELGLLPPIVDPTRSAPQMAGEGADPAPAGGSDETDA